MPFDTVTAAAGQAICTVPQSAPADKKPVHAVDTKENTQQTLQPPLKGSDGQIVGGRHHDVVSSVDNWIESTQMYDVTSYIKQHPAGQQPSVTTLLTKLEEAIKAARIADFNDRERKEMDTTWDTFVVHPDVQRMLRDAGNRFQDLIIDPNMHGEETVCNTEADADADSKQRGKANKAVEKAKSAMGKAVDTVKKPLQRHH